jgi:hypothetical protein
MTTLRPALFSDTGKAGEARVESVGSALFPEFPGRGVYRLVRTRNQE